MVLLGGMLGNENYITLKKICSSIKRRSPDTQIYMGGALATFCKDIVARHFMVDGLVIGDGHKTNVELVRKHNTPEELLSVPGLAIVKNGILHMNQPLCMDNKLRLPRIPLQRFDMDFYKQELVDNGRAFNIVGSKGCYSKCTYCVRSDKKMRYRNPNEIITEMLDLYTTIGLKRFNFVDDNYLNSSRFVREMVQAIKTLPFKPEFLFQGRVDRINETMLRSLKEVGLKQISFGIESADQRILDEMKKGTTVNHAHNALKLCRKLNIRYHASFIIGMPTEDDQSIAANINFIREHRFKSNYNAGFLTLLPGTELYTTALLKGQIQDEDYYLENLTNIYNYPYTNLTRYSDAWLIDAMKAVRAAGQSR